jgi:hypothetical protein
VLYGEGRGRVNHLIPHAGDAQPEPIELAEGRCNDDKFMIQDKLWQNDCWQNHGWGEFFNHGWHGLTLMGKMGCEIICRLIGWHG